VFGLLGLGLWVQVFRLGPVILAGALTLAPLVFPYVVIATQEALRAVPQSLRDASLAMGATKWQTIQKHVVPAASPGVLTGAIFAASRSLGETAPLLVIGAFFLQGFIPEGPMDFFTPLPVQIFGWALDPRTDFRALTAASIVVFIAIVLLINLVAIIMRHRYQRRG
jgi:phosphate transport system permease protein